jgi:membrane protein implicated in regulation of membrane protease activity
MVLEIVFWHWWAFGAFLLIVELLVPGMFFLWMAEAAVVTGFLLLVFPALGWEYQLMAFSLLSVISIVVFRKFLTRHPIETDQPLLNQRAAQYVGRVFTLDRAIVNGQGKIRVDDSTWKIHGQDCEAGTRVKVVAAEGVVLRVEVLE